MESPRWSAFSEETLVFLSRLSDHAAIAITNARLYADLQAANIAKSEYVSLVSHELKTPMTSIRGYTDLLSQGVVGEINDSQANFLSTIRTNVGRMATLVSDLADVSRIEADRLRLEFSAVDIGQVIDEVSHSQKALIDEKNQELRVDLPADVPAVWGDQHRLVQILTNLVSNANKYTPREGSIEISAEVSPNTWDPEGAPQVVHVRVIDNGYGISEEDRKKIFQKFFRSDAQNIRDAPGTGLGLNIARHLVEMQGGRIWFESEIGSGSVFQFTVPVAATG
jgi:signal transduction histidine kinase